MVKPVLRYPGSKFRKVKEFIRILDIRKGDTFIDLFGGSLIVGINVRHLTGANVIINDYDKVYPITDKKAIINMCSFQGLGKNFTKAAQKYFNTRIKNGYWEKLDIYNKELSKCEIISQDYREVYHIGKMYVDPPYDNVKGLYKSDNVKPKELHSYLSNFKQLNKILISYNDSPKIRKIFKDWHIITMEYAYTAGLVNKSGKKKHIKELLISNFKIKESAIKGH